MPSQAINEIGKQQQASTMSSVATDNPFSKFDFGKLQQATRETKPNTGRQGKRKAAFSSKAPEKTPVKLQFSTRNLKPTDDDSKKAEAKRVDSPLISWLREGNGDREGYMEAREYLMIGPPYKGDSDFKAKELVKETGGKWMPNPLKEQGVKNGITSGWWSAPDDAVLEALIKLPYNERGYARWLPLNVPMPSALKVVKLIKEFEAYKKIKEDEAQQQRVAQQASASHAAQTRARDDVPDSKLEEVRSLWERFKVRADAEMLTIASRADTLGPHSGISPARRLARALHHNLVTPAQCAAHDFDDKSRKKVARNTTSSSKDGGEPSKQGSVIMFGKGLGMHTLMSAKEWEEAHEAYVAKQLADAITRSDHDLEEPKKRRTCCETCVQEVLEQFDDCCCTKDGVNREWTWCPTCMTASHGDQRCECKSESAQMWAHRQNRTLTELRKRAEQAAALVEEMGSGSRPDRTYDTKIDLLCDDNDNNGDNTGLDLLDWVRDGTM